MKISQNSQETLIVGNTDVNFGKVFPAFCKSFYRIPMGAASSKSLTRHCIFWNLPFSLAILSNENTAKLAVVNVICEEISEPVVTGYQLLFNEIRVHIFS